MPRRAPMSAPHRFHPARLLLVAALVVLTTCQEDRNPQAPVMAPPPSALITPGASAVLVGAGDIAACSSTGDEQTAQLLRGIPATAFTAADNTPPQRPTPAVPNNPTPHWGDRM